MDVDTIQKLIAALLLPVAAIGWIASNWLDALPATNWWNQRSPQVKSIIVLAASITVGLAAYAVQQGVSPELLGKLQGLYAVLYAIVTTWLAMYVQHQNQLARKDRKLMRAKDIQVREAQIKIASGPTGQG